MAAPLNRLTRIETPLSIEDATSFWLSNLQRYKQRLTLIQNALGGEEEYDKLPQSKFAHTDALRAEDLACPTMKGTDSEGREYLAFRLEDRNTHETFAVCFSQRAKFADDWTQKSGIDRSVFLEFSFEKNVDVIRSLINGTNGDYRLV